MLMLLFWPLAQSKPAPWWGNKFWDKHYWHWYPKNFYFASPEIRNMVLKLTDTLEQNGMISSDIGNTYQADHAQSNWNIAESDQIYSRVNERINFRLKNFQIAQLITCQSYVQFQNKLRMTCIQKRSLKDLTKISHKKNGTVCYYQKTGKSRINVTHPTGIPN